jgi:hypothetical protein
MRNSIVLHRQGITKMKEVRIEILLSVPIANRNGNLVTAQLLDGNIEEDGEAIIMRSETADDEWRVVMMVGFIDPFDSEIWEKNWKEGKRNLWFKSLGEMRHLNDGEIFVSVPDGVRLE